MKRALLVSCLAFGVTTMSCGVQEEGDSTETEELTGIAAPAGSATLAGASAQGQAIPPTGSVAPVVPAAIGETYLRQAFRNLLGGENFTATAMCDKGDLLVAHYVAGQNITVHSTSVVDPLVCCTFGATQGWRAVVTGNSAGPPRFVQVNAICLDFVL